MDVTFIFWFFSASLVVGFLTFRLWRRLAAWPVDSRRLALFLPVALALLLTMLAYKIIHSPFDDQNWSRLQRTFLLAHGLPIYFGKDAGPVINSIYGPVAAIAFLPVAFFHSLPAIMRSAEFLAIAFFFLPVLWLHLGSGGKKEALAGAGSFLVFAFFPFLTSSIRNGAFHVHADAPALGLGALACAFVYFREGHLRRLRYPLSAVCVVLAFYTKQVMAPLFVALPLYIGLTEGRRASLQYTAWLFVAAAFFTALFFQRFGGEHLFFNLFTLPSRHPWRDVDPMKAWTFAGTKLIRESFFIALLGFLAFRDRNRVPRRGWVLFLLVAIFLIPTSLAGRAKIGGSTNALCFTIYFLLITVSLALRGAKRLTWITLAVLTVVSTAALVHRGAFPKKETDFAAAAYTYAKKHSGEAYFPKMTVINFLAEGKVYHEVVGLIDYQWARLPVSDERIRQFVPERLKLIAFHEGSGDDMYMYWESLPEISRNTEKMEELPGFLVYKLN